METTFYIDAQGDRRERNVIKRTNNRVIHLDAIEQGKWMLRYYNQLTGRYNSGFKVFEGTDEAIEFLKFFKFIK